MGTPSTLTTDTASRAMTPPCALPGTPLQHASAGLDACVHCGFCLQACPTYVNLEDENESPRGRLVLMRRMLDGEIALDDPDTAQHIDRCLGCRACETACPSGVPYGELLEATRATMAPVRGTPLVAKLVLTVFRHHVLLRAALAGARLFRATGLPRALARLVPRRLGFPLAMLASSAPTRLRMGAPAAAASPPTARRAESPRRPVTMLEGCVMSGLFAHVNDATEQALSHNGFTSCATNGQRCCGALHAHAGDLESARALARENIVAFEHTFASTPDAQVVVNAAGCGAMLKQYGHLLHDDPHFAERAQRLADRTRDVSELLASVGPVAGPRSLDERVTHDPPCHQMHAQRIVRPPVQLLSAIPGIDLVPLEDADQCCGSAGIYNLVEPDTSDAVLAPKLARIKESHAELVATGNPGCLMQLGAGLILEGSDVRAVHPIELLAATYGSTES
ncbi:(Fe-S)-binding protein [Gemmatimonas sp.]|uniref:(Fe-S)-binding protein n=1 Tax=Gemmatimonas sp. TaxID=1962908 RepID=UPI003F7227CF